MELPKLCSTSEDTTTSVRLLPVCQKCGYVIKDTLRWAPPAKFEPSICPNCKRFIDRAEARNIGMILQNKGSIDFCDY